MLKIMYFIPFILGCLLYGLVIAIGGLSGIHPFVWLALIVLFSSGMLLKRNKAWGAILGILIGILLIYMGTKETGQIVSETPIGIIMCIYYLACGIISSKINYKKVE